MILAQVGFGGYGIVQWAAIIIVLALVVGVILALIRFFEIPVPAIVWKLLGFGLLAILALFVIFVVARFAGIA